MSKLSDAPFRIELVNALLLVASLVIAASLGIAFNGLSGALVLISLLILILWTLNRLLVPKAIQRRRRL